MSHPVAGQLPIGVPSVDVSMDVAPWVTDEGISFRE